MQQEIPSPAAAGTPPNGPNERRRALQCMVWAGSAVLWTVAGGVPRSSLMGDAQAAEIDPRAFTFAQVSDSHIGFHAAANPDVAQTFHQAVKQVARLRGRVSTLIHTGDVSHLGTDEQFDTARQILHRSGMDIHVVPGEHDMLLRHGQGFYQRFSPQFAEPLGAYTFDDHGVHFIALNNVSDFRPGGLGRLGAGQLAWLKADLQGRSASQPIVVLAHMPLWSIYPQWGWGTDESAEVLEALKPFGSVTVLNGHIHQVLQKVEGNVAFHTAVSTAFPLPAPGKGPGPIPVKLPANDLARALGTATVHVVPGSHQLAVVNRPLGA